MDRRPVYDTNSSDDDDAQSPTSQERKRKMFRTNAAGLQRSTAPHNSTKVSPRKENDISYCQFDFTARDKSIAELLAAGFKVENAGLALSQVRGNTQKALIYLQVVSLS